MVSSHAALHSLLARAVENYLGSGLGESAGDGKAYTVGRTCNESNLALNMGGKTKNAKDCKAIIGVIFSKLHGALMAIFYTLKT